MEYRKMLWLTPILLVFHNIEEYLTMHTFVTTHWQEYPAFIYKYVAIIIEHFSFVLVSVTILIFLITFIASISKANSAGMLLLFIAQVFLLLNAVQHILASIWMRAYTPGVITSISLYLPILSYLILRAFKEGYVFKKSNI